MPRLTTLGDDSIRRLHRREICERVAIDALLEKARSTGTVLHNGVNRRSWSRKATIVSHDAGLLTLRVENITPDQTQLFLNFDLEGSEYFFACSTLTLRNERTLVARSPSAIYETERRDLRRVAGDQYGLTSVELQSTRASVRAEVRDSSYHGLGVVLPASSADALGSDLDVVYLDGDRAGHRTHASVRHRSGDTSRTGWTRLGLAVRSARSSQPVVIDSRERILDDRRVSAWTRLVLSGAPARIASARIARRLGLRHPDSAPHVVDFTNAKNQPIRGILDSTGDPSGATAVLIPPSWGRTKETFLALSHSLVRTFAASGESVAVLRFDGTNRRGESYVEPAFREPGREYLGFTFSSAVQDIHAAIRFLKRSVRPARIVLVTFSLASVEGRRAVASDPDGSISGWVSVVGMVDLQSGLRAVSGGVDFAYGLLEGVRFGRQELVGVLSDMDATGEDALRHRLVFLEDARRDVASITVPITWIHGRHDAWMDIDRAVDLLSSGDSSRRSLIEIPTGHQLRSSAEALETFQLIALEVGRIALGRALKPMPPDPVELEFASRSERGRRPQLAFDARSFWRDYLLGRARDVGFQLLTATSAYQRLMGDQIELLGLKPGSTVLDLGSGTGELAARLADCGGDSKPIRVVEIDLVPEALARSRARLEAHSAALPVVRVVADLELGPRSLPVRRSYADAALLSLVISYVTDPLALLACTLQSLRSGGRVVVSTMKPDADISALYVEGIAELPRDRVEHLFGREVSDHFEVLQREFLNSAAHLLDLEQDGRFRFYPSHELCALVQAAGFVDVETTHAFGEPAQAVVVFARKP